MTIYDHEPDCNCDACTNHREEQGKLAMRRQRYAEHKKEIVMIKSPKKTQEADSLESRALKTRWKKCSLSKLIGADYALRIFMTSPVLRGEALKICEMLINQVREEINSKERERRIKREPYDKSTWLGEKE